MQKQCIRDKLFVLQNEKVLLCRKGRILGLKYEMELGAWNQVFAVPAAVVDRHLKMAGSAQLKVLLWLLRRAGQENDPEEIGASLGLSRADVCDAMQYWIEAGLIREKDGELTPAGTVQKEETAVSPQEQKQQAVPQAEPIAAEKLPRKPIRPRQLDSAEVAARINSDEEIRFMMDTVQSIFGRPISTPEMGTLLNLHDWDGLPADVVVMLVQYAVSTGKNNMAYIEKMAISWASEGIDTHEKAERKICELDDRRKAWNRICKLFGIEKRPASAAESEAVSRWINLWQFDDDLIREAYDRCVDSTGKVRFSYINKILERWNTQGVRTVAEARSEKDGKKQAAKPVAEGKRKTSYDINEFEKMALNGDLMMK